MSYLHRLLGRTASQASAGPDRPRFTPSLPSAWAAVAAEEPDPFVQPPEGTPARTSTAHEESDSLTPPVPPPTRTAPPAPTPVPLRPAASDDSFQESARDSLEKPGESPPPPQRSTPSMESERRPFSQEANRESQPDLLPAPLSRQASIEMETVEPSFEERGAPLAPETPPTISPPADSPPPAPVELAPREEAAPQEPVIPLSKPPPDGEERQERSLRPDPPSVEESGPENTARQLEPSIQFPETHLPPSPPASAEPRVVIGRLHVEVVPQTATAPTAARPARVRRRSRRTQPANASKLRFGLGQS